MRGFVKLGLSLAVTVLLASAATAGSRQASPGRDLATRVEATLAAHLDGERIARWRESLPAHSLEREAADWILAWLPLSDQAALDLPLLREHVEEAAAIYRIAPWRDRLPHELWLRFVVPHRVSQEPAQAWRGRFRAELWPRVKDAPSMEAAALAVNRWCREQATFRSTSGRDQGPLTTVARGIGRCEEEMILTICALRAVGIPARSCATPYWSFTDNNHAWVETWADGRWWYLGGCEPDRCLNRAWFTNSASRTGFVRSVGYGEFDPAPEPLYRAEDGATRINSTGVYTDPIHVTATLGVDYGEDNEIAVNVLNFGSLRPVARIASGETIALGPGEYAFTAGDGEELLLEVAGGRGGERIELRLDDDDRYDLDAAPGFWLRYPETDARPARDLDLVSEAESAALERGIAARDGDRAKLRAPSEREREILAALPAERRERLAAVFEKPFERISTLFRLLADYPPGPARGDLLDFLADADDKDLLELDYAGVRAHVDAARGVRGRQGLAIPDSIFREGLLACRIAREPGGAWRDDLPLLPAGPSARGNLDALLAAWAERVETVAVGFFGAPLDPAQCWALGRGAERDLKIGLVGLLRVNGFPARYRHGRVEAWLGDWLTLDAATGRVIDANEDAGGAGRGRLEIVVTRGGEPYPQAESYRHFNVARFEPGWFESPWWDPLLGEQDWDAGDFVLSTANRVPGGSVYGRLRRFAVAPGALTRVELPLDIGPGWEPGGTFFAGPSPAVFDAALAAAGIAPDRGDALTFVFAPDEPALRMIAALGRVRERLVDAGVALRFVPLGEDGGAGWREAARAAGFEAAALAAAPGLRDALAGEEGFVPVVALRLGGELRYCRAGFDTAVDQNLHLVLDLD